MENDISLIERVKKDGDEESLSLLIQRHSGIYLDMVNSVIPNNCDFLDKNDILEEKDISIYKAILNFDPEKNTKFSTYLGNETKWKCLNLFNRGTKYKYIDIEDFKEDSNFIDNDNFENIHSKEILNKIFSYAENHSDRRISEIIKLRYKVGFANKTMPWKEIAKKINLSIQGCINIHNKFIEEVKKELQNV
jgi:RNA polymerase sigma factor (sigma-70 family)